MHANVKALKNAATSAPAPKWFVAQPWAVLQIPKREFPRLAPPPTAAQQLEYFRRSSPNESKLKLETGPHADAVVGPTVAPREILRWRIKVVDCDAGELSLKVTCAPLGDSWYMRSGGLCLWAAKSFRLRNDEDLHGGNKAFRAWQNAPSVAEGLECGKDLEITLDRNSDELTCGPETCALSPGSDELLVPLIELGMLSDAKWAILEISEISDS